jgi:TRAP-type mannitol/chloroaromatic compound transport system substrate-binding protein
MGAVVMTRKAFESIPRDHQEVLKEVFQKHLAPINAESRGDNEEALDVMVREGIKLVELSPEELERFQKITQEAIDEITGKVFSKKILRVVRNHLVEARTGKPISVIREEKFPREP